MARVGIVRPPVAVRKRTEIRPRELIHLHYYRTFVREVTQRECSGEQTSRLKRWCPYQVANVTNDSRIVEVGCVPAVPGILPGQPHRTRQLHQISRLIVNEPLYVHLGYLHPAKVHRWVDPPWDTQQMVQQPLLTIELLLQLVPVDQRRTVGTIRRQWTIVEPFR